MFYSGIIIIVIMVMFSIIATQSKSSTASNDMYSLNQELEGMDASYRSLERSLHIIADVSLKRAVVAGQSSVIDIDDSYFRSGQKAPNVLKQLMWNGTIPLNQSFVSFMENNTLEYNIRLLEDYYSGPQRHYNISIGIDYANTTVGIYDAYTVYFNTTVEINLSKIGVASLSRRIPVFEKVSILGFEDSLYLVNVTQGKRTRSIEKSRYIGNFTERIIDAGDIDSGVGNCYGSLTSDILAADKSTKIFYNETFYTGAADSFCGVIFASGDTPVTSFLDVDAASVSSLSAYDGQSLLLLGNGETWGLDDGLFNITNFVAHYNAELYISSSNAPSFFDMLEGNANCTYCDEYGVVGLESFINKNTLSAPELHLTINTNLSSTLHEYLQNKTGERIGLNTTSIGPNFYAFRMNGTMGNYFD